MILIRTLKSPSYEVFTHMTYDYSCHLCSKAWMIKLETDNGLPLLFYLLDNEQTQNFANCCPRSRCNMNPILPHLLHLHIWTLPIFSVRGSHKFLYFSHCVTLVVFFARLASFLVDFTYFLALFITLYCNFYEDFNAIFVCNQQ